MARELEIAQSDFSPGEEPLDEATEVRLKAQVLELAQRIAELADQQGGLLADVALAQEMAQTIKPYVDRLVALQHLLNPVDRIVAKRQQIHQLQAGIAQDVAEVEDLSGELAIEPAILNDLQGELAAVKKDRKLFVGQIAQEDDGPVVEEKGRRGGRTLLDLPVAERFALILGQRFISLERLGEILDCPFSQDQRGECGHQLEVVWEQLFSSPALRPHAEHHRVKTLQNTLGDYALLFRSPFLAARSLPCSLENLRQVFGQFFLGAVERHLWYTRVDFYRQPLARGHWALVDRQYLNCTFKKPSIRLLMYARANGLPSQRVRQKSVVEDVYDRIVLELAIREHFFDNCHSITSTMYQQGRNAPFKQVYTYYKDDTIRISGKNGTPHWRPTKPRWPGVLPSIVFSP
jgi:hypothetical protein